MKKLLGTLILVGVMMLAMAVPASAFEICFGFSGYGNSLKLEVTQFGNTFLLTGHDRAFAERAAFGSAYITPSNTVQLAVHVVANASGYYDVVYNANLSLATLSGTTNFNQIGGSQYTGVSMSSISCSGVPDSRGAPDTGSR